MHLETVLHFGYAIMIFSILWMVWLTYASAAVCQFDPYCTCSYSAPHLGQVECKDIPVNLPSLNTSKLFTLTLINNNLNSLPPNLLSGTGLYQLKISNNPIYYLHEETLSGLERSLWEIHVTDCKLSSIPANMIRHLFKLKTLNLTGNGITQVSADQLRGVANSLQNLIMADNHISILPPGVFSSLLQLELLDLHGNAILTLEPSVFTPAPPKLRELNLSDNLIESISYKQLGNIRSLHILDLSRNQLMALADAASSAKLTLEVLSLEYNEIIELTTNSMNNFDIANRTSFRGNPMVNIQPNAFQGCRISELILSDCKLTTIDPESFNGLENSLQYLDLTGNNISTFSYPLLDKYEGLRSLYLDYNQIQDVAWMKSPEESQEEIQLVKLHMTGKENKPLNSKTLPKLNHLQSLAISQTNQPAISPDDFEPFSVELEIFCVTDSNLKSLDAQIFKMVRGIRTLDLTDNYINKIDSKCFSEIAHSLEHLILTHSFDKTVSSLPRGLLKPLTALKTLKINHNYLMKLSHEIQFLSNLEILHAQDNNLDGIPKGLFKAGVHSSLKQINLSFNRIPKIIAETFVELDRLEELNLADNNIVTIETGSFVNLDQLTILWLRGNRIQVLPAEVFQNLRSLSVLDVAYNALTQFNFASLDQVGMLSSLTVNGSHNLMAALKGNSSFSDGKYSVFADIKVLDLSYNNISSIEKTYFIPVQHSLTKLYLSHNSLPNATRDIFPDMLHLQLLDMSHNRLTEIEFDAFRSLKFLQVVNLSKNKLKSIPIGLFHSLHSIRYIDLSSNQLVTLMDSIISSQSLVSIDLSNNALTRIPLTAFTPSSASGLIELKISGNKITSLPIAESFGRFSKLRHLDVSLNRFTEIGNSFSLLPCLTELSIAHNHVHIGSKDFVGLENTLEHLDLSNVSISYVPPLPLPSLLTLNMAKNLIAYIPLDLHTNLTNLKELDVSFNSIQSFPQFPHLKMLNVAGNQISSINNTSFTEFPFLTELDIRHLPLVDFDIEGLIPLQNLETLHVSNYKQVPNFNVPRYIRENKAIRSVHYEVGGVPIIGIELSGPFSEKVSHLIISGYQLKSLPDTLLNGIQSSPFKLTLRNTSVDSLQGKLFTKNLRSLSIDVSENPLKSMANPSNTGGPDRPKTTYLVDLSLNGKQLNCDCKLGWIETWQRKRRQFWPYDHIIEDSREAKCKNKQDKPLLTILKSDLECGWGNGHTMETSFIFILFMSISVIFYTNISSS